MARMNGKKTCDDVCGIRMNDVSMNDGQVVARFTLAPNSSVLGPRAQLAIFYVDGAETRHEIFELDLVPSAGTIEYRGQPEVDHDGRIAWAVLTFRCRNCGPLGTVSWAPTSVSTNAAAE